MALRKCLSITTRELVFERDGGFCYYCGRKISAYRTSIDHMLPVSRGGTDQPDNLALACPTCNRAKGARTPEEYAEHHRYTSWRRLEDVGSALYDVPGFAPDENPFHQELAATIQRLQDAVQDRLRAIFPGPARRAAVAAGWRTVVDAPGADHPPPDEPADLQQMH